MTFTKTTVTVIILVLVLSLAGLVALLVYTLIEYPGTVAYQTPSDKYVNCMLNYRDTKEKCIYRGCVWLENATAPIPPCVFHETQYGYVMQTPPEEMDWGWRLHLQRISVLPEFLQSSSYNLSVDVEFQTETRLRIKFYGDKGYEVPERVVKIPSFSNRPNKTEYDVQFEDGDFFFTIKVFRKDNGRIIFNTDLPGFIFSQQFHQISIKLSSDVLYGFGEHSHKRFQHDMQWRNWSMFARDEGAVEDWNLYGVHPFYMNLESDGKANGVLLLNSNAMEIILQPLPAITYRVIGGILDFYIFLGPTPENVVQQYTEAIGRPVLPPYWILGFQLSRWGYKNLTDFKEVVNRNWKAGIPYDVQYSDIDYMDNKKIFTYDEVNYTGLPEFIEEMHKRNQKYIVILDPGVAIEVKNISDYAPLELGLNLNIFVKDNNGKPLVAEVWPGKTYFPDFLHPNITNFWTTCTKELYEKKGIEFDGLWLDMNEPSNFQETSTNYCSKNNWNYPVYAPNILGAQNDNILFEKTICMDALHYGGLRHYDVHSLYGHTMAQTTHRTLSELFPDKRPMILTRSTFTGTGHYAIHWLGDNQSKWPQLHWSIIGIMEFNLFGIPLVGSDICGFWEETDEEMCLRWSLLGSFYPFARNHNGMDFRAQDPAAFGENFVETVKKYLEERYRLLPYLYTLLYFAHTEGSTVVRPLFHEFSTDSKTWGIDTQFLWGPSLLISPALEKNQTIVKAYFPAARWYNYFSGEELKQRGNIDLKTPNNTINVHLRGGFIIPTQEPNQTTTDSRKNPLGLVVALDERSSAHGSLFWDDGISSDTIEDCYYSLLHFNFSEFVLSISPIQLEPDDDVIKSLIFSSIKIFGLKYSNNSTITIDNDRVPPKQIDYDNKIQVLHLCDLTLNFMYSHDIIINV